ncbi:hypothetical protein MWU49_06910 [Alcanivorax sp. S6407]|uniref:RNA polymerase sigma factor n=1 Tax=Alcanivorax sp. S6407 TaxID=2926424 RepID=UPI001FF62AA5|nr:sigma factor-like helix-turn-helix DNA-binding protein [Alcanivorax sp. S6407]MCK0153424.1 hypothetical protein [Alcanivorax sp. S6407]
MSNPQAGADPVDWPAIIFDPAFMAGLERMAARRFVQPVLAEEACTAMLEALSDNDWAALQGFTGKSAPGTYAHAVAGRAMEDYARRKFGRPRPPQWLQAMGQGWVRLWRMLCLERQWPETIQARLAEEFRDGLIQDAIGEIKRRIPRCGEPGFAECCVTELGLENLPDDAGASMDAGFAEAQRQQALTLMSVLLQGHAGEAGGQGCPSKEEEALSQLVASMSLSADDRLLLALHYEDGLASRRIAELTGSSAATVQRRLQALRQRLHGVLAEMGMTDNGEVTFEFGQ